MGFFIKAIGLAVSVLASVFTSLDAPQAKAKTKPAIASHNATARPTQPVTLTVPSKNDVKIVLVGLPKPDESLDAESKRFLELIRSMPKAKEPVSDHPWFMADPVEVFRALVGDSVSGL